MEIAGASAAQIGADINRATTRGPQKRTDIMELAPA